MLGSHLSFDRLPDYHPERASHLHLHPDVVQGMLEVADLIGEALTLTVDPGADAPERWVAVIGLDHYGAGDTATAALSSAMKDWYTEGVRS